eukprot:TRINITY_DN5523_c0_g1_i3.p1 TRINITY_DN5523_c0_g1~~TRINITY_DN5523_c0_g1_i3.p1  ORF type:complete len:501 (+),score=91.19 TRINITY_DN5523_c0_g1_i3:71-1573(+)
MANRPRMLICHICGQGFGTMSLPIHQKACIKKWEIEQSKLPQHLRSKLVNPMEVNPKNFANIDEYNDAAFSAANSNLVPCENCGRTFKPESLQIHLRSCVSLNGQMGGGVKARLSKGNSAVNSPQTTAYVPSPKGGPSFSSTTASTTSSNRPLSASKKQIPQQQQADASNRFSHTHYGASSVSFAQDAPQQAQGSSALSRGQSIKRMGSMQGASPMNAGGPVILSLVECSYCHRRFNADRIEKHMNACAKLQKPRKKFDSTAARVRDTELEGFRPKRSTQPSNQQQRGLQPGKQSVWKRQHEEFIRAIREAKKVSRYVAAGGNLADLPPPPPSENPDYVQCPHCKRRFNETAAKRHIPACSSTINKPKPPPHLRNPSPQKRPSEPMRSSYDAPPSSSQTSAPSRSRGSQSPMQGRSDTRTPNTRLQSGSYGGSATQTSQPQTSQQLPRRASAERRPPPQTGGASPLTSPTGMMAKFCGNCGFRYQSANERFCCQCGCKRS